MKQFLKRISNTKSIMAILGSILLILQTVGIKVDILYVNELVSGICALLVLIGVLNKEGMETIKLNK